MFKLIDVSHLNTISNWQAVKDSGVSGVIIKATQGTNFTDPQFINNVRGAQSVGLLVAPYHFVGNYGDSWKDPVDEAANFLRAIEGVHFDLLPVIDAETDPGAYDVSTWVKNFESAIGFPSMLYTYTSYYKEHSINLPDIPTWIADYNGVEPTIPHVLWQYSDAGNIPGIVGNVDLNQCPDISTLSSYQTVDLQRVTTSDLNLRVAPGTSFAIRSVIPQGTEIHITKLYGGWAYTPDQAQWGGWVSRKYLTIPTILKEEIPNESNNTGQTETTTPMAGDSGSSEVN